MSKGNSLPVKSSGHDDAGHTVHDTTRKVQPEDLETDDVE